MTEAQDVGWRVGAFALEALSPKAGAEMTTVAVWHAYKQWCVRSRLVPLAEAIFFEEFSNIAVAAGLERRQRGGNVSWLDVALKS